MSVFFPDYDHSILNISNAVLHHYGVKTEYKGLSTIERALKRNPKNVVLWIWDGMGVDLLEHLLSPQTFTRRHVVDEISSVFPPTTTAATTTYYSGIPPVTHGWVGWSPYFQEHHQYIELFTGKDVLTHQPTGTHPEKELAYTHIFQKISSVNKKVTCTRIFPKKIELDGAENFEEEGNRIIKQAKQAGNQFIIAYWPDPDHTCHHEGTYSDESRNVLKAMNSVARKVSSKLKDTVIIISADHGHVPVLKTVYLDEYPDLENCLAVPVNLDDRVYSVFLKPGKEQAFRKAFDRHLKSEFFLIKSDEALKKGLFGKGSQHKRTVGFLGDYLIIAVKETVLRQRVGEFCSGPDFASAHAGLTQKEMVVPLILVDKD